MAISIGDALLKLGVDTKDLDKGMKGLGDRIKKHQKAIGIGMVAMGGAILAAGALSIKTFAEMGDEVAKLARKTGISTETLSELRHVAEISGTSLAGLEKATKRMATAIGDAQDGLTETIRDFDKLGISIKELEGLSPEEVFMKLGQAIADVEDPLVRANIAQGIFGRAGMDLIPMFDEGAEAMATLRQEAHDLGIVFDQEAAKKAEEMTDAMHRVKEATSGIKMAIAEQLVPILIPLIDKIRDAVAGISAWMKEHPGLTKVIVLGTIALGGLLVVLGTLLLLMPAITATITLLTGKVGLNTAAWIKNTAAKVFNTAATGSLTLSIGLLTAALAALAIGLAMVAFGIYNLVQNANIQKKVTEDLRKLELEYIKVLSGKTNEYNKMLLAYAEDIKLRQAMGRAAEEEIAWLNENTEALKALREEQTLQSDVMLPELQEQTNALTQANIALGNSYGHIAGMAREAWEALSGRVRAAGMAGYYEKLGYSAAEIAAEQRFGEYFGAQPFGPLIGAPPQPSLYRPRHYAPGELANVNVSVYLDSEPITSRTVEKIETAIRGQGGF